jgi:hypothetical protein
MATEIVITPAGTLRCIYCETLDFVVLGAVEIRRASFVEPDSAGNWFADLAPVNGPSLGPFPRRSDALAAETQWLNQHWLIRPGV